ncbi:M23 family metallopeptidase [Campylobacter canadensis]|uniref:M23 family metallopeptidase n=1 Tax=Campylobacter canadensis TaxID=449520 RepID=A0ABS7WSB1_9BACT|nr:M23 family metallopeptidase [Campylobacter canadensis]MBZ7987656.1 M23 family metallopeptidase [Campylobacter canadensis]MBZ7995021.1 M23 family metallopeptidase [Campylobacter canadensis]MBZ7996963.1 M23 family metallopeptidase [Campylobacter canadensis]MBZ7998807.1 M23 family metallopeptidase [Campylobacter canadensis]MBZ8000442.1 M23 family metallopeptidase [Campylobacter canadensis]
MKKIIFLCLCLELFAQNIQNAKSYITKDEIIKSELNYTNYFFKDYTLAILAPFYKAKLGEYEIEYKNAKKQQYTLIFGEYKKENIQITKPQILKKNKKNTNRINKELNEANLVYKNSVKKAYLNKKFILPINSKITSAYGSARLFNNEVVSYHSGTDFKAAIGTKIKAANDGIVVLCADRIFAGKSVIIDHGYGVFTQYYHLSKILVKVGDEVKLGDIVGLSGDTGRVSGPHFHFGVAINGLSVEPLSFIEEINKYLK